MAISDLLPGIEVTVRVAGVPLNEFDNDDIKTEADDSEEKKVLASRACSKYIEAVSDKRVTIEVSSREALEELDDIYDDLDMEVESLIHGVQVQGRILGA